jgi:hypothetical protein
MAAPTRGNEETLLADNTSITSGAEATFDWDLSGAWYGEVTIEIAFPFNPGDIIVYDCPTAVNAPGAGDYPTRNPFTGRQVGLVPATQSSTVTMTFYVGQGVHRIRTYNSGAGTATIAKCRGRKYT